MVKKRIKPGLTGWETWQKKIFAEALQKHSGNVTHVGRELGLCLPTVRRKLRFFGLRRQDYAKGKEAA